MSLQHQIDFIAKVFHPLIKDLQRPQYRLSDKYLGSFYGGLQDKNLKESVKGLISNQPNMVRKWIYAGLQQTSTEEETPAFTSFLVAIKRHGKQKATDKNLDMHMCVYTVRKDGKHKDSIYFDPAPPCHGRSVPDFLCNLRQPKLRSATVKYGEDTQASDCLYQCFKYLIALFTGEIGFDVNLNSNYFVVKA